MKLGGWLRLWIVLSGVLLLVIAAGTYIVLPTASDIARSLRPRDEPTIDTDATSTAPWRNDPIVGPWTKYETEHGLPTAESKAADNARWVIAHKDEKGTPEFKRHVKTYRAALAQYNSSIQNELLHRRLRFIAAAFAVWLGICATMFAFGRVVGWVYQGFRGTANAP